jgi:hypothetical protein
MPINRKRFRNLTRPEGFRHLGYKNDHEVNAAEWIVYDALYAYYKKTVQAESQMETSNNSRCGNPKVPVDLSTG